MTLKNEVLAEAFKEYEKWLNLRNDILTTDTSGYDVVKLDEHERQLYLCNHNIRFYKAIGDHQTPDGRGFSFNGLRTYKTDPVAFIERELHIFNPDLEPANRRFLLFKFQRDFIYKDLYPAYLEKDSILDEKTRQMGLSWLYCAFSLWGLLFDRAFTGFMLSKKEALVDDGGDKSTKDSLFGKIRYMYDTLDDAFKDQYRAFMKVEDEAPILAFKSLRIVNEITGAYMVGSSANIDAGRGGTYKFAFWDEVASTPKSEVIFQAFKIAGRCKCYNSTVRGRGNVFARLRWDETKPVKVSTLHWSQHPYRVEGLRRNEEGKLTSLWYEHECKGMTKTQIGQELDIDYEISVEGRIYSALDRKVHFHKLDYNQAWKDRTIIAWDLGISDEMFAVVMQADGMGNFGAVDEVVGEDFDVRFYIDLICGIEPAEFKFMTPIARKPYEEFLKRSREREYRFLLNVAGPDVVQRSITSKRSVLKQFQQAGQLAYNDKGIVNRRYVNLRMVPLTGYRILDRITEVKKVINPMHNRVIISEDCPKLWERLVNYKWNQDAEGQNKQAPLHDWTSHGSDAFGYGILYYIRHIKIGVLPGNTQKKQGGIITERNK